MSAMYVLLVLMAVSVPAAPGDAAAFLGDTIYADGWGRVGRIDDGGGITYAADHYPCVTYFYYAFHSLYIEDRWHTCLVFPLDSWLRHGLPTSVNLCYNQSGVTGILPVAVTLVSDPALQPEALYPAVLNGARLTSSTAPGPNGFYRRPLSSVAGAAIDSCRAQGWIAIGLAAGTHHSNGVRENITIDTLSRPFLEVSWGTGVVDNALAAPTATLELCPNPVPSGAPVRLGSLPHGARISVVDICGRTVSTLVSGQESAIEGLVPGVYAVTAVGRSVSVVRKLVVTP